MRIFLVAFTAMLYCGTAAAQSKKYPPSPPDKDVEEESKSKVWESAIHPERRSYDDIVAANDSRITRDGRPESVRLAIAELDKAVKLQPQRHEALQLRAQGYERLKDYARCAKDLELANQYAPRDASDQRFDHRRRLGVCQARAGEYSAAEHTLGNLASAGATDSETWLRLGEVRIALGKLDEAITALTYASTTTDSQPAAVWLLAMAYDRARMPSQTAETIERARFRDSGMSSLMNPTQPFLGVAEADYMLGLGYGAGTNPRPEYQLVYFQRYLKLAVDSPWRKRAEEHLKELRAVEFPERRESLQRFHGAALDMDVALGILKKGMPAMRACLAKTPGVLFKVRITKAGPLSTGQPPPRTRIDPFDGRVRRPSMSLPPASGIATTLEIDLLQNTRVDIDSANRCVDALAEKLKLPVVKEKDSAYAVEFLVAGP